MAIQALLPSPEVLRTTSGLVALTSLLLGLFAVYLYLRPALVLPAGAPQLLKEDWPLIGTLRFFTARWDFFEQGMARTGGAFSFHVGAKHVVAVSGDESRKTFFESKDLSLQDGYVHLLAGSPEAPQDKQAENESAVVVEGDSEGRPSFIKNMHALLKGDILKRGLPCLISDTRKTLDKLAADPKGTTDPYDSIYRLVYQLTMRTVACNEIAEDPALLARTLHLYEEIEKAGTPTVVMFPHLPTPAKLKRMWGGAQLYMIFKKIVDERKKTGKREDDALQFDIDQGDDIRSIITFVLGALFAGQLNSGINAAALLVYLSQNPEWQGRARTEIETIATKYNPDTSLPLPERLAAVPIEAWETEFKVLDLCLKDSIRLLMVGAAFRRNNSGRNLQMADGVVVPADSFIMYHIGDVHLNPAIYPDPTRWDPARYLPDRAEDKNSPNAYVGWGTGRHPCPGQRFARLENNIIMAFWLAYFDFEFCDGKGRTGDGVSPPEVNFNGLSAHKPKGETFLKYRARTETA